jgi:hypothetical protein
LIIKRLTYYFIIGRSFVLHHCSTIRAAKEVLPL